ncbi:hypothetical protein DB299_05345 (plasmid) [Borreliella bavariensis PBi]|uniref:Uncharacterized protein n=1 Tax=Borrelia garinii subsp. bavariensis (strain ATCC BAA-2496 / DSM 23469 / PBi) TaxID=290434 RepID=A0ABM7ART1_BORGP|nr:hypothetical protein DB299_05345 [Borreliella bavariensis PBi]
MNIKYSPFLKLKEFIINIYFIPYILLNKPLIFQEVFFLYIENQKAIKLFDIKILLGKYKIFNLF